MGERLREFVEKCFRAGVRMRLEYAPYTVVGLVLRSFQRGADFCRMMRVVVHNSDAVEFPFIFETAVRSGKGKKSFLNGIHGDIQQLRHRDGGKRV